jgi:hypothetical protein
LDSLDKGKQELSYDLAKIMFGLLRMDHHQQYLHGRFGA